MDQALTIQEIEDQFQSEWILVENPDVDEAMNVRGGTVRFHSPDRDEVYRKAIELRPKRFAIVCTSTIPEGTAVIL